MYPDIRKGIGGVVCIMYGSKSIERMICIVEANPDLMFYNLLPVMFVLAIGAYEKKVAKNQ
jgi:hypothetical protein